MIGNFPANLNTGNCRGYCAVNLHFKPKVEGDLTDYSGVGIVQVVMSYAWGSAQHSVTIDPDDFQWNYPNLTIRKVVTNTASNYQVDFSGPGASGLGNPELTVKSGLCVVENVDLTFPPTVMVVPNSGQAQDWLKFKKMSPFAFISLQIDGERRLFFPCDSETMMY